MEYEFYVDVFWMKNFCMDIAAMLLVMVIRRYRPAFRVFAAAAVMDAAACAAVVLLPYPFAVGCIYFFLNPFMVWWAFSIRSWKRLLQDVLLVGVMLLVEGGIWQWCGESFYLGRLRYPAAGAYAALLLFFLLMRREKEKKDWEFPVELYVGKKTVVEVTAFYDSGNRLRDPYTNEPVSILSGGFGEKIVEAGLPWRLIPYESLGEAGGLLRAVTVEKMVIHTGKRVVKIQKPVIGISENELFSGKNYHMLLNAASLEGEACT